MSIKYNNFLTGIALTVFVLAVSNIYLNGTYFVIIAFLLLMLRDRKLVLDNASILLIWFSMFYISFYLLSGSGLDSTALRVLIVPCSYMIGAYMHSNIDEKKIISLVLILGVAMAMHGIINFLYIFFSSGIEGFSSGLTVDFWSQVVSSATGQASYYFVMAAILGFVLFSKIKWSIRIMLLVIYIMILLHNILLGGRTIFVLFGISIVLGIIFFLLFSKQKANAIKAIVITLVVLLLIYIIYVNDFFNIKRLVEGSYFHFRFFSANSVEIVEDGRWDRKIIYLKNMLHYPFGGNNINKGLGVGYAHDLWLDVYDTVGVIPFVLICAYSIISMRRCLCFIRYSKDTNINLLVCCVYISLFVSFFVEPIMDACPMVFAVYCFIDGMLSRYMKEGAINEKGGRI